MDIKHRHKVGSNHIFNNQIWQYWNICEDYQKLQIFSKPTATWIQAYTKIFLILAWFVEYLSEFIRIQKN